jgi:hypothetical protein
VVTRADYGGLKLHPEQSVLVWTPNSILSQLRYFFATMKTEWGWGAMIIGLAGMAVAFRDAKTSRWACALGAAWILSGPAFFLLSNLPLTEPTTPAILQPYMVLAGLLWAPFVMIGAKAACTHVGPSKKWVVMGLISIFLLGARRWIWVSARDDFFAYDYACNLMRVLPANAVLYEPDDPTHFSLRVLQTVEHRRPDIVLLSFFRTRWGYEDIKRQWPDLLPPIPIQNGQELQRLLWSYSAKRQPFYAELPQKFGTLPYRSEGLAYAALASPTAESRALAEERLAICVKRGDFVTMHHPDFFTSHLISYYSAAENNLGVEYTNSGDWPNAVRHYQEALRMEPDQSAAQRNLAFALQKMPKHL